jgi:hypothetical protein
MSDTNRGLSVAGGYEIRLQGRVSPHLSAWFEDMDLVLDADGTTVIRCPALDQAGLHGLLAKVRDLGLPLISVTPISQSHPTTKRSSKR